jgi:hypothetical protein
MVKNCTETDTLDVEVHKFFDAIRDGNYRTRIEKIRTVYNKVLTETGDRDRARKAIDPLKKKLPAVMLSGKFSRRASDALLEYSGLICVELDSLGENLSTVSLDLCWFTTRVCDACVSEWRCTQVLVRVCADP